MKNTIFVEWDLHFWEEFELPVDAQEKIVLTLIDWYPSKKTGRTLVMIKVDLKDDIDAYSLGTMVGIQLNNFIKKNPNLALPET